MKWSPVIGLILIIVLLSAVFASSDSFSVVVEGPNTYRARVIVPTPTPQLMDLREAVEIDLAVLNSQENVKVEVSIPEGVSLPIKSPQDERFLNPFHLCLGDSPCSGGILAKTKYLYDSSGDGLADKVVLQFDVLEVQALWPVSTMTTPVSESSLAEPTATLPTTFTVRGTFYGWRTARE